MITGKNYIGNKLSKIGDKKFKTFDPKQNTTNSWTFYEATDDEVNEALTLAEEAFKTFKTISGKSRANFLVRIADEIEALGDDLISVYCKETGLPEARAKGERARTIGQLKSFAKFIAEDSWAEPIIERGMPDRQPIPKPDLRKIMVPLGPVAVFGASNFPLAYSTAGGDTASALASGSPVVVKSHPLHAGTGELISKAIIKAANETGMPNGVFSNLNSSGVAIGEKLVQHSKIKAIGFTGSLKGGRALYNMAAKRKEPIPVFAEMGSVNPVILLSKALEKKGKHWAKAYANSIVLGAGQFCTNPGLLFGIKSSELDNFGKNLSEEILKIEPFCMLNPKIKENYLANKIAISKQKGVQVIADIALDKDNYANQRITAVSGKEFIRNKKLHAEVFGPFSMIVECENKKELEDAIASIEGQLTGTIISEDAEISDFKEVISILKDKV